MVKKNDPLTLDELRDKSIKSKTKLSFGKEMGGYNKKQVTEHIENLTENLRSAEDSFNNRLEEYVAMITMLKQERDQYGEMYNLCKSSKVEMSIQIEELKRENEELNKIIGELSINHESIQSVPFQTEAKAASVDTQKKLEEYLSYEQESKELKTQLDQLKSMVRDLNSEIDTYAKTNMTGDDSGTSLIETAMEANTVLKSQYDDALRERSALLKENNRLLAENNKANQEVATLSEQLRIANDKCNERIQELISVYESNADEFLKNHQATLVQLTENMKVSLNLIKADGNNLSNLMNNILLHNINREL